MAIIIKEAKGCVIYTQENEPIILDSPIYEYIDIYKEWKDSAQVPQDGTIVEGMDMLHLFCNGTESYFPKTTLFLAAAQRIYNHLAEIAERNGYRPFDESNRGKAKKQKFIDVISLILSCLRYKNQVIRIPWLMDTDNTTTRDDFPIYATIEDSNMLGVIADVIRDSFPIEWKFNKEFTYSFLIKQYVTNRINYGE